MEALSRRLLGVYFVVTSVASVPAALASLGIQNPFGPWWILPLVPMAQGVIFAGAGLLLLRQRSPEAVPAGAGVVFPPMESLLQLWGVYFIVAGLTSLVQPMAGMILVAQSWPARIGGFVEAAVWCLAGLGLVTRPRRVSERLRRYTA
jgi:hypothetical protein